MICGSSARQITSPAPARQSASQKGSYQAEPALPDRTMAVRPHHSGSGPRGAPMHFPQMQAKAVAARPRPEFWRFRFETEPPESSPLDPPRWRKFNSLAGVSDGCPKSDTRLQTPGLSTCHPPRASSGTPDNASRYSAMDTGRSRKSFIRWAEILKNLQKAGSPSDQPSSDCPSGPGTSNFSRPERSPSNPFRSRSSSSRPTS
jgi:hypothetical protein